MKKALSVILTLTIMLGAVFTSGMLVRSNPSTWQGTTTAPTDKGNGVYEISTPEQLAYVIKNGGGEGNTYKLTTDIYLNDTDSVAWADGTIHEGKTAKSWYGQWDVTTGFLGTLDGQGHMVYGLYYTAGNPGTSASNNGYALIPYAGNGNVTIKNLGVDYAYLKGSHYSAAILGFCKNTATVNIENCFAGKNSYIVGAYTAGIVGGGFGNVNIKNCYSLASFRPTISGQGIIGNIWANNSTQTLLNCFTTSSVVTNYGKTTNCYAGVDDSYKGVAAKNAFSGFDFDFVWMTTEEYPILRVFSGDASEDALDVWGGKSDVEAPTNLGNNIFEISKASQLAYVISTGGGEGNVYKLTSDIYLNYPDAFNWQTGAQNGGYTVNGWYSTTNDALQLFSGTLDGQGHIVYGLYYRSSWQSSEYGHQGVGLIPKAGNAVIKNIGLDRAYIYGEYNAGGIVGLARVTETVSIDSSFSGERCSISGQSAGGIFGGGDTNLSIANCYSLANLSGVKAGGITGDIWSINGSVQRATNCYTTFNNTGINGTNCLAGVTAEVKGQEAIRKFTLSEPYCQVKDGYPTLRVFVGVTEGNWNGLGQSVFKGSGTASDPYIVENANQLAYVAYSGTKAHYKMANDIYVNDVSADNWQTNENLISWIWQEEHEAKSFKCYANQFGGTFDGNGYTVYGVWYPENTDTQVAALFPAICGATIKNLGISNSYMYAGYTKAYAIEKGYATESNVADLAIGIAAGIVGWSHREGNASSVSACFADETVYIANRSDGNLRGAGGIVGFVMNNSQDAILKVSDCWSAANVSSTNSVSANGIVGGCWNAYYTASDCYSIGSRPWMIDNNNVLSKTANAYTNCYTDTAASHESYTVLSTGQMLGKNALDNMQLSDDVWYAVKAEGKSPIHRVYGKAIGDVDENGVGATIMDVVALRTTILKTTAYKNSDINRNGKVDVFDLVYLHKNISSVVVFSANGGAFANGSSEKKIGFVSGKTISIERPTRDKHQFLGWSLTPNGELIGNLICTSEMEDSMVYAVWREKTLALSPQFSDNMVLQRNKPICVYGTGKGEGTVTIGNQTKTVSSNSDNWEIYFEPMAASAEPVTFKTKFFGVTTEYENVVIGDVYIVGGQSNMEMTLRSTEQSGTVEADSLLRFRGFGATKWNEFTETNVESLSAIAALFAQNIRKALNSDIPVGVISTAVGASRVEDWTHSEYCCCEEYDLANTAHSDFYNYDKGHHTLYATHIQPIEKMTTAGVLWYQGESNRGVGEAYRYLDMFKTMVNCWRTRMDDSALPFYTVQIMLFSNDTSVDALGNAVDEYNIRISQCEAARTIDNVTLCTMLSYEDTLSQGRMDIHPTNKAPIAEALASAVLTNYYNANGEYAKTPEYCGPLYDTVTVNGNTATVTFTHIAEGLMLTSGDVPTEFEVRDENGKWKTATATLSGNTVTVTADGISTISGVRLGYRNRPEINLYNKINGVKGYCASPFVWTAE